jgi:hypothetical protein
MVFVPAVSGDAVGLGVDPCAGPISAAKSEIATAVDASTPATPERQFTG